jgi:hypothetical protein
MEDSMLDQAISPVKDHQRGLSSLGRWILSNQGWGKRVIEFFCSHIPSPENQLKQN